MTLQGWRRADDAGFGNNAQSGWLWGGDAIRYITARAAVSDARTGAREASRCGACTGPSGATATRSA
jgi:hypothetical protein